MAYVYIIECKIFPYNIPAAKVKSVSRGAIKYTFENKYAIKFYTFDDALRFCRRMRSNYPCAIVTLTSKKFFVKGHKTVDTGIGRC